MPESEILGKRERGAWAETFCAQWLIERGYWVSRNIAHDGPFDLVAVNKVGKVTLFDVKYVSYKGRRRDASSFRVRSDLQKIMKIHLLVVDNEGNVSIEPPINGEETEQGELRGDN
jgi:Holliday junction resolvase-like predicted endonuclease